MNISVDEDKLPDVLDVLSDMGVKVSSDIEGQLEEENTLSQSYQTEDFGTKYSEDNTINNQDVRSLIEEGYSDEELKSIPYSSFTRRDGKRIVGLKEYINLLENEKNNILGSTNSAIPSVSTPMGSSSQNTGEEMGLPGILPGGLEERIAVKRTVIINMDMFSRGIPNDEKAATILHEMIHQQTQIAIGLYQSKIFRPILSPTQLKALGELEKIF